MSERRAGERRAVGTGGDGANASFLRSFGRQIKLFRERTGMTQAELAEQLGYGEAQVAAVEQGRRIPRPETVERLDQLLAAGGVLLTMKDEVAQAHYPAFFRDAARIEAVAVEFHAYANHAVPGLLQTEEYARAVLGMLRPRRDRDELERLVAARMARAAVYNRKPAPELSFVLEDVVLRRRLGGDHVRRGQLEHLLLVGQNPNVEIQVLPTDVTEHAGLDGPFTLMTPVNDAQVAYVEGQKQGTVVTDREMVRVYALRYGILRAQSMPPRESLLHIEKLLGEG